MNEETNTPEVSTGEADDLRGALESAFEAAEAPEAPAPQADASPAVESPEPEAKESSDRPRGPDGKFVKKAAEESSHGAAESEVGEKEAGGTPPASPPVVAEKATAAPPVPKPPASWKPQAREAWAALPDHVRNEILRREGETSKVLSETAEARKFRETFQQAIAPYEHLMRAEGAEPLRAVQSLLHTASVLRTGPREQAAQMVAQIVRAYNVPIEALDAALAGQPVPAQAPVQDPRVDQLLQQIEMAKRDRAEREAAEADSLISEFGSDKEFFDDVRQDMADLIEVAERRGQKMDLETAYKRAIAMNDEISAIMRQREEAKAATTAKAATSKAKAAASSVRSSGPPQRSPAPGASLRDELASAWEQLSQ